MGPEVTIAILAAGAGTRMRGGDKTLEPVEGQPLLGCLADRALALGLPVRVTLPPDAPTRRAALAGRALDIVTVSDAASGMAASFRALSDTGTAVLVCLADMPAIETAHMASLIDAFDGTRPVRATASDGTPGQPVLFPSRLVAQFAALTGDTGARSLLTDEDTRHVALPDRVALIDLDTPEAWAAWRDEARQS